MKVKGRGILVVCLLVFGGLAVYDFLSSKQNEERKQLEARLMLLNFQQVEKVEIHRQTEHILLLRDKQGWRMEQPFKERADNEVVDKFIKDIYPERILEVAAEGPQVNWIQYGLDPAFSSITLTDTKGRKDSFHISEKKNFENNIFARRNKESKVVILNPSWEGRANKAVLDFRDRRIFKFNIAAVDELILRNSKGSFTLQRVDGKWKVRGFNLNLDQNKVRELLKILADAKADRIEEADKADLSQAPLFHVEVRMEDKKWSVKGSQEIQGERKIFALTSEPKSWLRVVSGDLDELIKKELVSLEAVAPAKGETATLESSTGSEVQK